MCLVCGVPVLECVYCMVCMRWAWKRCLHSGEHDSERWGPAEIEDFEPVPRMCRIILAGYEEDLRNPKFAPQPHGYGMDPDCLVERVDYAQTHGRAPPYIVYVDKPRRDVVVAIRGLNMAVESDYALLWDNKLGQTTFDGGFVHNGLLKSARWIFDRECSMLSELLNVENPGFSLTFAGHSLGSGIAALLALIAVNNRERLGGVARSRIRCFSIAPARCMSLNLAVRYADVINSIILQDDFLPRTATPLEDIFKSVFCLPCLLCIRCLKDTCIPEERMLADPRRLYAPGRLYHIVERKVCRCGKLPPVVKTAVPVEGRFEHIVLSCNATSDHAIIWIERESQKALDLMIEKDKEMEMPTEQRMQRQQTLIREHDEEYRAAVERAETLKLPQADSASYGTFDSDDGSNHLHTSLLYDTGEKMAGTSEVGESSMKTRGQLRWKHLVGLFTGKHKSNHEPIDGSD